MRIALLLLPRIALLLLPLYSDAWLRPLTARAPRHGRVLTPRASVAAPVAEAAALPPLVPREVLFGNPEFASPVISPDGARLAYLKPSDGVLNVWVRTVGETDDRVVTADAYRGIRQCFWAEDSTTLMYMQDDGGDENFHLFAIDTAAAPGTAARDLTPFPGAKAQNVITNKRFPGELLVAVNQRDPAKFDMYRCELATGELTLDTENPGDIVGWGTEDETFEVREALRVNQADSSKTVLVRDDATSEWRPLIDFPYGEEGA